MGGVSHANTTHLLLPQRCSTCAVKCAKLESFANNVNSITVSSRDGLRFSFYYTLFFCQSNAIHLMLARLNLWLRFLVDCSSFMLAKSRLSFLLALPMCCWGIGATWTVYICSDKENCTFKSTPIPRMNHSLHAECAFVCYPLLYYKPRETKKRRRNAEGIIFTGIRYDGKWQKNAFLANREAPRLCKIAFYHKYSIFLALKVCMFYQHKQ